MKNTAIESVNKKWEGSKNATLQLVDMECSYITVDFFRKLSTALRIPSVLLHCGRCDSVQRILLMLRYEIVTASTLANGGLAMKSEEEKRFLRELLRQRGSAREEEEEKVQEREK
ncbi:BnaC03g70260D [Brassica napus]|uniref:BnaC03g70260D protein n=2 Tax=Brassica TaxID=3705 RepID=A0A078FEU0_BRANA|nr:BnaC03g70260D [Brassica napus]